MGRKQIWQPEWFRWAATILDTGSILSLAHSGMWGSCHLADGRIVFVAIVDRTWRVCERKRIVSRGVGPESLRFYLLSTTGRLGSLFANRDLFDRQRTSDGSGYRDATDPDERQPIVKHQCAASEGTALTPKDHRLTERLVRNQRGFVKISRRMLKQTGASNSPASVSRRNFGC
jgi:hypothetical protein